ncbi:MAG TPA: ABC transporter permease [Streptosporangiaceae bacterium]|nr:ABC transporter permease [Streptosporangiaceae bacterium]
MSSGLPGGGVPARALPLRVVPPATLLAWLRRSLGGKGSLHLIERHARAYRHLWLVLVSGLAEPLFYLLSLGIGLGQLVGTVAGPNGQTVTYTAFVGPALLATSSMNGAIYDSTFGVFFLLKYAKVYDAILATPMRAADVALGQIGWALIRGSLYAFAFMLVMLGMGLLYSPWAVLALPSAILTGFAFAAAGMAATTFMRSWQDFEYVMLVSLPMFLFSTTFYPLSIYPRALQIVVECTPLYQAITLIRGLTLGVVGPALLVPVAYLALMGLIGLLIAGRRVSRLLLK